MNDATLRNEGWVRRSHEATRPKTTSFQKVEREPAVGRKIHEEHDVYDIIRTRDPHGTLPLGSIVDVGEHSSGVTRSSYVALQSAVWVVYTGKHTWYNRPGDGGHEEVTLEALQVRIRSTSGCVGRPKNRTDESNS